MIPVLFGVVGAILGGASGTLGMAALGFLLGVLWNRVVDVSKKQTALRNDYLDLQVRHGKLENELRTLKREYEAGARPAHAAPPPSVEPARPPEEPAPRSVVPPQPPPLPQAPRVERAPNADAQSPDGRLVMSPDTVGQPSQSGVGSPAGDRSDWMPAPLWLIEFFTTGNVVAKVGMVIVFFGVAFLVRYAADRGLLPIEYRLIATVVGALMLLGLGWRLRRSRREYAMVLQGGAVGLLYLTIFAAFRLYDLLPATLTFALLLFVVALSGVLAVLQNAMSLAVLGTSGGFLAPILASTGGGSHVALFSYYGALNAGVLGISWFRSWRFLNWLSFVFTFGIGFIWGQQYYQPELFATTEPFLVGFLLLFVAVAVLFALRQPPDLRGYVDGSLVFGTPAIAFGMQSVLVRDIAFGRAYSAAAVSALYLTLAYWLWRGDRALRPLAEAFLAVAVVFLILAVPLAFDGHATAAAWALEGTGLVWIGIRQHRLLARLAGCALLVGAGVAFAVMTGPPAGGLPVLNARFLASAAIAAGSVMASRLLSKGRGTLTDLEGAFEWVLLAWGLLWWFGAVLAEIERHVPLRFLLSAMLLAASVSCCLIGFLSRQLNWRTMMLATMPIGPLLWTAVLPAFSINADVGPLADLGWLAWPVVVAGSYLVAFWFESIWPSSIVNLWHAGTAWLLIFLVTWTLAVAVHQLVPETPTWSFTVWCAVPSIAVLTLIRAGASPVAWPLRRFESLYAGPIAGPPTVAILLWVAWACSRTGSAAPLPYVPLLNPLELTQTFGLIVAFDWWTRLRLDDHGDDAFSEVFRLLLAAVAFVALNVSVGRIVHFYLKVPFDLDDLADSAVFQASISILWGLTAGALMTWARRRLDRSVWMVGAGLLAALILKLFLVDLGGVGTVARIVSFLATGVLILVIGYFAPVPPKAEKAT
jgi:uncharacterized membrane protein